MLTSIINRIKKIFESDTNIWALAIFTNILVAWFSEGFHHFDEHFQILEFMNLKLGKTTVASLPWEYKHQIRPWFQPYLYLILDTPLRLIDASPFLRAFFLRMLNSLFLLSSLYFLFNRVFSHWFKEDGKRRTALLILLFSWFIPYINVRASSESLSIGFFLYSLAFSLSPVSKNNFFLSGLFSGLSYLARFQMGLPVAVLWFWGLLTRKWSYKSLAFFAAAIIICFGVGFGIDSLGYGEATFPLWNYFRANFLEGVLDSMGVSPWYKYFEWSLIKPIPPISFLIFIGSLFFWWRERKGDKSWLTYVTLIFILFHTLIGHKEFRFIFLCAYLLPIAVFYTLNKNIPKWVWALNIILLLGTLKPANRMIPLYKFLYQNNIHEVYYVEEDPTRLVGLPLKFYLPSDIVIKKLFYSEAKISQNKIIFTKRYPSTKEYLEKNCEILWLNYPKAIFTIQNKTLLKILKKSKVMGLFSCR